MGKFSKRKYATIMRSGRKVVFGPAAPWLRRTYDNISRSSQGRIIRLLLTKSKTEKWILDSTVTMSMGDWLPCTKEPEPVLSKQDDGHYYAE